MSFLKWHNISHLHYVFNIIYVIIYLLDYNDLIF